MQAKLIPSGRTFFAVTVLCCTVSLAALGGQVDQKPLTNFDKLHDGDLVFIESVSKRAPIITALTESPLTHCGIIFKEHGQWMVYEGAGRGVGVHLELADWQKKESGGSELHPLYVRRLHNGDLVKSKLDALKQRAGELHDTQYDLGFAWENRDADGNEYIYCSELVWKVVDQVLKVDLGTPHALSDYYTQVMNDSQKQQRIKAALDLYLNSDVSKARRGGQPYRPGELAISPVEVFNSQFLDAVTDDNP